MSATIPLADEMIHVLTDAIASKRATIAMMKRAQDEASTELRRLTSARAIHLARRHGFEVGQVWLVKRSWNHIEPGVVHAIQATAYGEDEKDWGLQFLFASRETGFETVYSDRYADQCLGQIEQGTIVDALRELSRSKTASEVKAA